MVPDRQKVRTDGQWNGRTDDAKTISLRLRWGDKNQAEAITVLSLYNNIGMDHVILSKINTYPPGKL